MTMVHVRRMGLVCLAGVLLAGPGCSGAKVTTKSSNELPRYQIRTLALVPFTSLKTPQMHDQRDSYFSTPEGARGSDISIAVPPDAEVQSRQTATVPGYAEDKVTQLFWRRLQAKEGLRVLPPGDAAKVASTAVEATKSTSEMAAANLAKRLKVDAALVGRVLVFQERVGSRMGASPAAAVGFEVKVVAADGQVLWAGNYYERQRPMTEDFMGFIHRWAFVTADELAQYGVDEVLKEFPFGAGGEK
jgi:hypothetical protein